MLFVFPPDTNAWCCYPLPSSILKLYSLSTVAKITEHTLSTLSLTSTPIPLSFPHPFHTAPMISQNLPHLSVSTLFQLPDTSYIYYHHSVLHSIYMNPKQVLVLWCFTTQATPYINGIHSTSPPPSIHVQCPDAIIALLRVRMSLAPTHLTSTFPFLYLDFLWSPNTSHILVLKSTINTTLSLG